MIAKWAIGIFLWTWTILCILLNLALGIELVICYIFSITTCLQWISNIWLFVNIEISWWTNGIIIFINTKYFSISFWGDGKVYVYYSLQISFVRFGWVCCCIYINIEIFLRNHIFLLIFFLKEEAYLKSNFSPPKEERKRLHVEENWVGGLWSPQIGRNTINLVMLIDYWWGLIYSLGRNQFFSKCKVFG